MIINSINNLKSGLKVTFKGEPFLVLSNEFVKPGKGQAFSRVTLRNLLTNKLIDKTFRSTDLLEEANIIDVNLLYLYKDNRQYIFMNEKCFEYIAVDRKILGSNVKWLLEQTHYVVTLWNNNPISVCFNNFISLKVVSLNVLVTGDRIHKSYQLATLSTGVIVKVPLFIKVNNVVKIDIRSGEYISRIQ
ncbi:elongation factor P [Buchnera aphidicola]|uniref:elongation factor P n=1 Tax=Buchnera aphidicola TaxID=9 RepID=UPI0031B7FB85